MRFFYIAIAIAVIVLIVKNKSRFQNHRHRTYHRKQRPRYFTRGAEENGRIGESMVVSELGGTHAGKQYL